MSGTATHRLQEMGYLLDAVASMASERTFAFVRATQRVLKEETELRDDVVTKLDEAAQTLLNTMDAKRLGRPTKAEVRKAYFRIRDALIALTGESIS